MLNARNSFSMLGYFARHLVTGLVIIKANPGIISQTSQTIKTINQVFYDKRITYYFKSNVMIIINTVNCELLTVDFTSPVWESSGEFFTFFFDAY